MRKLNRTEAQILKDAVEILQSLAFEGDERRADFDEAQSVGPESAARADELASDIETFTDFYASREYRSFLAHTTWAPDAGTMQLLRDEGYTAAAWQAVGGVVLQPLLWDCEPFRVPNWEVAGDLAKAMCRS